VWLVVVALSAWLVGRDAVPGPRPPRTGLLPHVPEMGWYHGQVVAATVEGWAVPPPGAGPAIVGAAIGPDVSAAFETRGGDDRASFVPALFVHGGRGEGYVVAGQAGPDAAVRVRLRAARWRLRAPWLVLPGALGGAHAGDPRRHTRWQLAARGDTVRLTVAVDGRERAGVVRLTPTMAWALLVPYARPWGPERRLLNALWLAAFLAPAGYWLRRGTGVEPTQHAAAAGAAGALVALGLGVVPHLVGAAAADGWEWIWALVALGAGYALGRGPRVAPLPRAPSPDSFRPCPPSSPPPTGSSAYSGSSSSPPASRSRRWPP
jgi:hypothetical protein